MYQSFSELDRADVCIQLIKKPRAAKRAPQSQARLKRLRNNLIAYASAALLIGGGSAAWAQESCTQLQAYLTIAPNHREDVMAYVAPRLKQKMNVDLVAEAIGSAMMVDRLAAQAANP